MDHPDYELDNDVITVKEIRDLYFCDAVPIEDLPGVHCTGLLAPSDKETTHRLWLDLYYGWGYEMLLPGRFLCYCTWQLAVVVYSSHQIYLFTFEDLGSYAIHLTEIRACFRRG